MSQIPQQVLGEALSEAIRGRQVHAAVFTTFTFDPGFFELQILPYLFDRPDRHFHRVEKARRAQLEEALRSVDEVAVYYDRQALAQDAGPAQTDFRRIDVRRATGVFHPKIILAMVDDPDPTDPATEYQSLVVGLLSANLTRAGWWENVETAHFEEVRDIAHDASRVPFRKDLLSLVQRVRQSAFDEEQPALDAIHEFLRRRTQTETYTVNKFNDRHYTRLFTGQTTFPTWLEELGLAGGDWNLEILSPYFDRSHGETVRELIETVGARETRVFLPREMDGSAAVTREFFEAVDGLVRWSELPSVIVAPSGRERTKGALPRRVHAKVYRLWRQDDQDIVIAGSLNFTAAAHSHGGAGNLEAAFLVDCTDELAQRWWLKPLDKMPSTFSLRVAEASAVTDDESFTDVSFLFQWDTTRLTCRSETGTPEGLMVAEPGGRDLFVLPVLKPDKWVQLGDEQAKRVRELLRSTSYLEIRAPRGVWRVLVREEGTAYKPSVITTWTPEEILMYWSLLSPAQRERFLVERLTAESDDEGLAEPVSRRYVPGDTVFDRFAGVYQAFERLHNHIVQAIEAGQVREAEERLLGQKFDSLPVLLKGVRDRDGGDPVLSYVTFLSARQVRDRIAAAYPEFLRDNAEGTQQLDKLIADYPSLRERIDLDGDASEFFDWYESQFLRLIEQPEFAE